MYRSIIVKIASKLKTQKCGLEDELKALGKTRWLDLGSKGFNKGFCCMNIGELEDDKKQFSDRYYEMNALELTELDYEKLGKFDLIRMQHVFEHFSFEEGIVLLKNCAKLLDIDGYLLITVPDLKIMAQEYLSNYKNFTRYRDFAIRYRELPEDVPASCVFSVFAHQSGYRIPLIPGDAHKWCYDYEGLEYQVQRVNEFKNIRKLGLFDSLAGIPFTHNRPYQDVCLIAQKK
ncbi:MAG: hypothetical protein EA365_04165 [Gloeocapsa sp. DLM2.Bin57]|nr:MAG: hypothetical protein EA365_04165 [Gloeocapsa sp. DLM2.Bin57]